MKHFKTSDLLAAIRELMATHSVVYAEDCLWAVLRCKLITIDQFTAAMRILYPEERRLCK